MVIIIHTVCIKINYYLHIILHNHMRNYCGFSVKINIFVHICKIYA